MRWTPATPCCKDGGSALDAVTAAIIVLEDVAAVQRRPGRGVHRRRPQRARRVDHGRRTPARPARWPACTGVKNPILLARTIMEQVAARDDGRRRRRGLRRTQQGIALVDPRTVRTEKRWQQLRRRSTGQEGAGQQHAAGAARQAYFGTVGAVALDAQGRLAAGTSTGGMTNKRYGRVGDAPIIGAGTWADDRCAVSGTGWGEFYIRAAVAHDICARVRLSRRSAGARRGPVINRDVPRLGGDGGAIALDARRQHRDARSTPAACTAAGSSPTAAAAPPSSARSEPPRRTAALALLLAPRGRAGPGRAHGVRAAPRARAGERHRHAARGQRVRHAGRRVGARRARAPRPA